MVYHIGVWVTVSTIPGYSHKKSGCHWKAWPKWSRKPKNWVCHWIWVHSQHLVFEMTLHVLVYPTPALWNVNCIGTMGFTSKKKKEENTCTGSASSREETKLYCCHFYCHVSVICSLLALHHLTCTTDDWPRSGRLQITTPRHDRYICMVPCWSCFLFVSVTAPNYTRGSISCMPWCPWYCNFVSNAHTLAAVCSDSLHDLYSLHSN